MSVNIECDSPMLLGSFYMYGNEYESSDPNYPYGSHSDSVRCYIIDTKGKLQSVFDLSNNAFSASTIEYTLINTLQEGRYDIENDIKREISETTYGVMSNTNKLGIKAYDRINVDREVPLYIFIKNYDLPKFNTINFAFGYNRIYTEGSNIQKENYTPPEQSCIYYTGSYTYGTTLKFAIYTDKNVNTDDIKRTFKFIYKDEYRAVDDA